MQLLQFEISVVESNEYYCVNITPGRVIFGKYTRGANDNHEFPEFEKSNYFATEKGLIDLLIKIKKEIK